MMRRRRRTALLSVLVLITLGWLWQAVQSSPDVRRITGLDGIAVAPSAVAGLPPSPTARPSVPATPAVASPAAVSRPTGRLDVVSGDGPVSGAGPLKRYIVEVEEGLGEDPQGFAATVEGTLADRRSWGRGGVMSFQRVDSGPVAFRVLLASPPTVDRYCAPLQTNGYLSCYMAGRSVLNVNRWRAAVPWYADELGLYRQYVINHEVGHALGSGHEDCPESGALAPVMQQQTKGLQGCRRNAWPHP